MLSIKISTIIRTKTTKFEEQVHLEDSFQIYYAAPGEGIMLGLSEHDKICYHSFKKGCEDHVWTERLKRDIK